MDHGVKRARQAALRQFEAGLALLKLTGIVVSANGPKQDAINHKRAIAYAPYAPLDQLRYMAKVWRNIARGGNGVHSIALKAQSHLAHDFWKEAQAWLKQ